MKWFARFFVSLLLISRISNITLANDSLNVRILGETHDFVEEAYDVSLSGNYAYLSSGLNSGLRVIDFSDPVAPVEVGYAVNSDTCTGVWSWMTDRIRVSGNFAYVLYFDGTWSFAHYRLYLYDISDPALPWQTGYLSLPDNCTSLFINGDYVYVASFQDVGISEVTIIDVSNPMLPVIAGYFSTPGMAHEVYVTENTAYVADNNSLVIFDVTNPASPIKLGSYAPPGGMALIHCVTVTGSYAVVTDAVFGIRILDISNPSGISEAGSVPHNQSDAAFSSIRVSDNLIYYAQDGDVSGKQLVILDMSDPETPVVTGSYDMPGSWWIYGFDCCNGYACIAGGKEGFRLLQISSPDLITEVCTYDPCELTSGLAVSGSYAFVATNMNDLLVYDVSDPSSPVRVKTLEFPDSPIKQISVWGNHLYVPAVVADHTAGVSVLDISDPANPEEIAYWPAPEGYSGAPFNVERYGNYAFVACALGGVEIYDVEEISQPEILDNWTLWNPMTNPDFGVTNVKISWPWLYAPDRAYGLYVLDISDPSNIIEAASFKTPGDAMWIDISADQRYIYVADGHEGLTIIDVSDPLVPVEAGFLRQNLEFANHVAVCGDSVYVSDGGRIGLHVVDVSDPAAPVEAAYHTTMGVFAHNVLAVNGLIYFLDSTHFEIFEITGEPSAVRDTPSAGPVSDYKINSVYPNPFNSAATIEFDLAGEGHVTLELYNSIGQNAGIIVDEYYPAGSHAHHFDAKNLPSGIYILRLNVNGVIDSHKLCLMK